MTPRESKTGGCGKLIGVGDTVDGKQAAKGGAFTNAGSFKQSGIHAAGEARSGARFGGGGPRFIGQGLIGRSNFMGWPHLGQRGADGWGGTAGWESEAGAGRPKSKGFPE